MATAIRTTSNPAPVAGDDSGRWWWVSLLLGAGWLLFGFAILNGREEITTVRTVAVLASILFFSFGIGELTLAATIEGWRWVHVLVGLASLVAGTVAIAW